MEHNIPWIEQQNQEEEFSEFMEEEQAEGSLNLQKCRELVAQEVERNKAGRPRQQHRQQVEQWNSINKQITNIMNYKGSIDSQLLMDELIKQSRNNQEWIDSEFEQEEPRDRTVESEVFLMTQEEYEREKEEPASEEDYSGIN